MNVGIKNSIVFRFRVYNVPLFSFFLPKHAQCLKIFEVLSNIKVTSSHIKKLSSHVLIEIRCEAPQQLKNGRVLLPEDGGGGEEDGGSLRVGEVVRFACEASYEVDGLESLECLEDGTWSDIPPLCQPLPCNQPPL